MTVLFYYDLKRDMNRNVKLFLTFLIAFLTYSWSFAFDLKLKKDRSPMINYNEWIPTQEWADNRNGERLYFPQTTLMSSDTIAVVTGQIIIPDLTAVQYFLAALVFVSEHIDKEAGEGFLVIDYHSLEFEVLLKTSRGTNNNETSYTRVSFFKADENGLWFSVKEIDCRYKEKGLIPRTIRLEKLHPENNRRHAEIVREFVEINSDYLNGMSDYIDSRRDIHSHFFSELSEGGPVEVGMNMDEVVVLLGSPLDKRKSGNRTRWIYSNDEVIIFTDGVVSKIVN